MDELVWVTDAKYEGGYMLRLTFNDGKAGIVDFEPYTDEKPFGPLKNLDTFRNFKIDPWTVTWLDGSLDFAPEFLYEKVCAMA